MSTTVKNVLDNLKKVNIQTLTAAVIKKNEKEIIRTLESHTRSIGRLLDIVEKIVERIEQIESDGK